MSLTSQKVGAKGEPACGVLRTVRPGNLEHANFVQLKKKDTHATCMQKAILTR
jgi:hypothetical protein